MQRSRPLDAGAVVTALESGALEVHYQPIVMMPGREVIGFEALARLRAADGTLVAPADFIPAAEESGLIVALGEEVLRRAVARAAEWRSAPTGLATATISVNVAPSQLEQPDVVEVVSAVLAEHDVPGSALVLEITESTAAAPGIAAVIGRLSALGVRVAIDDFGTGFATLDTLRRIPAHMLKLDRSFVAGVTDEGADRAIVRVVIDLADSLGLSVVAEGIETDEQSQALLQLGCAAMQGYLFARPGPDPLAAAAQAASGGTAVAEVREGVDRWPAALDGAVLAAARLLGEHDPAHRGAVHAVGTALARATGLDAQGVRAVGRLCLVHDLRRLAVDGALPPALKADERLCDLASVEPRASPEVALVRAAVDVVDRATGSDPDLGRDALAEALTALASAEHPAEVELREVAAVPPDVVPFTDLMEDLDRRRMGRGGMEERIRSVFGITRILGSKRETGELMRLALEEVRRMVGAASASVERWERESNQLRCLVNVGHLGPGEVTFPDNEVYSLAEARRTMLNGLPYICRVDDPTADREAVAILQDVGKYSSAGVPVFVDGRTWGQLWFATEHGEPHFEARDIETLMAVATLMGGVVAQAEHLQAVDRMAFEDPLTGVGNRRLVDDALDQQATQGGRPVLVLLDIDGLKEINDTRGHATGDAAIRQVADALSTAFMSVTGVTIGRLGGDEFCVVLPESSADGTRGLLLEALGGLEDSGGPSVSFGLASPRAQPWEPRDLLADADEVLYRAKRAAHLAVERSDRRRASSRRRTRRTG